MSEKEFFTNEPEAEPKIIIRRSTQAPVDVKQNPFYDPELWGQAKSADDIYLPDVDEALSFAIAAHKVGHLVKAEEESTATLDNFSATRAEEQRAWDQGWPYIQRHLAEYYQENPEEAEKIQQAFVTIKDLMMQVTNLSAGMYLEPGTLADLDPTDYQVVLKKRRENFFTEHGDEIRETLGKIKKIRLVNHLTGISLRRWLGRPLKRSYETTKISNEIKNQPKLTGVDFLCR